MGKEVYKEMYDSFYENIPRIYGKKHLKRYNGTIVNVKKESEIL